MKQSETNGKYILQNELRTWSDLKRRAATAGNGNVPVTSSRGAPAPTPGNLTSSPTIPIRRWGGCANGCNHDKIDWPRRAMRKNTAEYLGSALPPPARTIEGEKDDHPVASTEVDHAPATKEASPAKLSRKPSTKNATIPPTPLTPASPNDASNDATTSSSEDGRVGSSGDEKSSLAGPRNTQHSAPRTAAILRHLQPRNFSGHTVGPAVPSEGFSDDSDYFPGMQHAQAHHHGINHNHAHNSPGKNANGTRGKSRLRASSKQRQQSKERKAARKMSEQSWMQESGMGSGARADALGDGDGEETSDDAVFTKNRTDSPPSMRPEDDKGILREALKGDMIVEKNEGENINGGEETEKDFLLEKKVDNGEVGKEDLERMKEHEKKSLEEVY